MTASQKPTADGPPKRRSTNEPSSASLRVVELTGYLLLIAWATTLVVWAILQPDPYAQGWRLVLELAFLGRLVNIADGITNGFSQLYLFVQSAPQDVILLLVVYPWVVRAYRGARTRGPIVRLVRRLHRAAEHNSHIVQPFGAIGLWAFVFFPFWSTGVLVGGVVGYIIGLRTWITFTSVFAAHILSLVSLIWFFEVVGDWMREFSQSAFEFLPWIVLGIVILVSLFPKLLKRKKPGPDNGP